MNLSENLIYSMNVVAPIFLLVLLGWLLKRKKIFADAFYSSSEKFVFNIALPCMIFLDVSNSKLEFVGKHTSLVIYCSIGMILAFVIGALIISTFSKDKAKTGAMVQGMARGNFTILGVPLAQNMFGDGGSQLVSILMPAVVLIGNISVVIMFSLFDSSESKRNFKELVRYIVKSIIKNPLIIAVVLAIPFMIFNNLVMPLFALRTLTYLSNATMALSLISLGACITVSSFKGKFSYAAVTAAIRLIFLPTIMVLIALLFGFSSMELGVIFLLFGVPTAISSYIMAKEMNSDYELAGQILLLTTLFGVFTLFLGVFIMKTIGCI